MDSIVETITRYSASGYPNTIQQSSQKPIQNIIDHGFWITDIKGSLVKTVLNGPCSIDYDKDLPRVAMMNPGHGECEVWFRLNYMPQLWKNDKAGVNGTVS